MVYVTVDPERDDAAQHAAATWRLRPELRRRAPARPTQLAAVRKDYGVTADQAMARGADYAIAHSSSIYLIDRDGRLRAMMPYGHAADDFVHDVSILLAK